MLFLTEDARLVCTHELGKVENVPSQTLVTIAWRRVLVSPDPEGRSISGCPNTAPGMKPCLRTLAVDVGYSPLLRIENKRVCLSNISGYTDGTPPGVPRYEVRQAGQDFVSERP